MENTNNIIVMYEEYKINENNKNNEWSYIFNFTFNINAKVLQNFI